MIQVLSDAVCDAASHAYRAHPSCIFMHLRDAEQLGCDVAEATILTARDHSGWASHHHHHNLAMPLAITTTGWSNGRLNQQEDLPSRP